MDRGEITLSKGFDTVNFEILIRKLQKLNLSKDSLKILASYLSNRYQYFQISDIEEYTSLPVTKDVIKRSYALSFILAVTNGVPQGPMFFLIHVFLRKNVFIRNLHVESSKIKKLLLLHSISFSEIRNLFFLIHAN